MWIMWVFIVVGVIAAIWAFIRGYRSVQPGAGPFAKVHEYTCKGCGASVATTDNLDGKCDRCWAKDFEAASERMDREV